ncbi:hypothetical protein AA313_de0201295 [Arthrobotrys entomopaga]|nr:hypothetical protein AA313_de0201295 [Arthrobotrys entomopaga]
MPCKSTIFPSENLPDDADRYLWNNATGYRFEYQNFLHFQDPAEGKRYGMGSRCKVKRPPPEWKAAQGRFLEQYEKSMVAHFESVKRKKRLFGMDF